MSNLTDYIAAGRAMDANDRESASLALQTIEESEQAEVDAAWDETIGARADDLLSRRVQPTSGRETIAIARARSVARRG